MDNIIQRQNGIIWKKKQFNDQLKRYENKKNEQISDIKYDEKRKRNIK